MARIHPFDQFLADLASADVQSRAVFGAPTPSGVEQCTPPAGLGPQLPPRGSSMDSASIARMIFPPRIEKLVQSVDAQASNYRVALGAGVGTTAAMTGFTLPTGQVGWLQSFSVYVLASVATTYVQWTVRINGSAVAGYDNIKNPPGIANLVYIPYSDMRVRIPSGGTVDVLFTNLDGTAAVTVGSDLGGWYHPETAEQRAWNLHV